MLYVFQMDVGQMLTFDISLLMDTVARLQQEIAHVTGISVDQQILLLSGGQSLHPDQKVISYGAGADTNPVFLFSKLAITSQEPPLIKSFGVSKEVLHVLKDRVADAVKLPVSFDTVTTRTKLAIQVRDNAGKILTFCNNEFKEQHLQHQGWSAVVANLEEIAQALQKTRSKFSKMFATFLPLREKHFSLLSNFQEVLELLSRIPLLKPLREEEEEVIVQVGRKSVADSDVLSFISPSPAPVNLLEWITTQSKGQSLEGLQLKCYNDLVFFNEEMFDQYERGVHELLDLVSADTQMKALVGIERRLSELEKRLNEAKRIAKAQNDMAQAFMSQQSRLSSTPDSSVLPDLCTSHKQQLRQMLDGHQRLEALQGNFCRSKQEMSTNIHHRLGWVVDIETKISKLDSDLIFHMKTLKLLEVNLELLSQVKAAPQVYAQMVMEAARRKVFSQQFELWADSLVGDSKQLYEAEVELRKHFTNKLGQHFFLHTLFKGFGDMPPNFATKAPQQFDSSLPNITTEDISLLKSSVPELEGSLCTPIVVQSFPQNQASFRRLGGSTSPHSVLPNSQSSQTEWSHQLGDIPSVVTATEAPPTTFSLPELQESRATEYLPAVSSLTDTMREAISSETVTAVESTAGGQTEAMGAGAGGERPASQGSQSGKSKTKANSVHTTESTSPLSSTEFATADFYIEDAMPSPMRSTSDSETISSLQAELLDKVNLIRDLEEKLRKRDNRQTSDGCGTESGPVNVTKQSSSATLVGVVDVSEQVSTSNSSEAENMEIVALEQVSEEAEGKRCCCDQAQAKEELDRRIASCQQTIEELSHVLEDTEKDKLVCEEKYNRCIEERNRTVTELEVRLKATEAELVDVKTKVESCNSDLHKLKLSLSESRAVNEELQKEVNKGEESLVRVRGRLLEFRTIAREQLSSFRNVLKELKSSVSDNKRDVDTSVVSLLNTVEEKVSCFNNSVLADANSEFVKEKEVLNTSILALKAELSEARAANNEKVLHLNRHNEELSSRLLENQSHFTKNFSEQQAEFDSAVKELKTKHSLELELEVEGCKTEMRKLLDEAEQQVATRDKLLEELRCEVELAKKTAGEERVRLETVHMDKLCEMEKRHQAKLESNTFELSEKYRTDFEATFEKGNEQIAQLKNQLENLEKSLVAEKEAALTQLVDEHGAALRELEQKLEEQREDMAQCLEQKQLDHAHKLTELKIQFDLERESLLAELRKVKDHVMTSSETQTDLLADVISLTSSASYGSEEMIANRHPTTQTEDSSTATDNTAEASRAKLQQTIDDLNTQLTSAQERISGLQTEVDTVRQEKDELMTQQKQLEEAAPRSPDQLSQSRMALLSSEFSRYQEMMESTGGDNSTSFILMDKERISSPTSPTDNEEVKMRDVKIAELEKKVMEISMTASEKQSANDKVSIKGCERGDLVLLCLDERHDQYVVFTVGANLHFLHSDSLEPLGLKRSVDLSCRKTWILAEVVDKEYCLAKKPQNRFRVPQGTCFYRVKCKPWRSEAECGKELVRHVKPPKGERGEGARPKKSDKA
ncbi:RB1-inducible coiled-coil protein 1 [Aplysia californica]|uniref:RB1-inducible coiled-coil protein 1 n=1 Tax=Aplysia californica TaxID=6500 RepID=A0ABM0ZXP9_APLCA|nr:RB1-inducible coiled-coil protein 1 [Aplysia californica]